MPAAEMGRSPAEHQAQEQVAASVNGGQGFPGYAEQQQQCVNHRPAPIADASHARSFGEGASHTGSFGDHASGSGSVGEGASHAKAVLQHASHGDHASHTGSFGNRPSHTGPAGEGASHTGSFGDHASYTGPVGEQSSHTGSYGKYDSHGEHASHTRAVVDHASQTTSLADHGTGTDSVCADDPAIVLTSDSPPRSTADTPNVPFREMNLSSGPRRSQNNDRWRSTDGGNVNNSASQNASTLNRFTF